MIANPLLRVPRNILPTGEVSVASDVVASDTIIIHSSNLDELRHALKFKLAAVAKLINFYFDLVAACSVFGNS